MLFVHFYQALYDRMGGVEAKMINWLRRTHPALGNSPFYLMIDEGRLAEVMAYLESLSGEGVSG